MNKMSGYIQRRLIENELKELIQIREELKQELIKSRFNNSFNDSYFIEKDKEDLKKINTRINDLKIALEKLDEQYTS